MMQCYIYDAIMICHYTDVMGRSREGTGGLDPLKNHKNIGFLSNTGPEPLKNQARVQCWAIIGLPAKCHLNGILLAGR